MVDLLRLIDHGWLIVVYHEGWLLSRRPAFITKASFYHEGQLLSRRLAFITKASWTVRWLEDPIVLGECGASPVLFLVQELCQLGKKVKKRVKKLVFLCLAFGVDGGGEGGLKIAPRPPILGESDEERPPGPQFWGSRMRRGEALRPPILGESDEERPPGPQFWGSRMRRGPPAPNSGGVG
jgi:hypothetical protein